MAAALGESSPLLPTHKTDQSTQRSPSRGQRSVSFNPLTTISTSQGAVPGPSLRPEQIPANSVTPSNNVPTNQPMLASINSKLRRRNSHGAPYSASTPSIGPRYGAQRTTKNAQKLKLLPNPDVDEEVADEESGRDVYSQFTRIKDPTARRDAARLGKADRDRLPRVTAYCTANAYRLEGIMRFMKSRSKTRGANPKQFDECIYSPYNYDFIKKGDKKKTTSEERDASPAEERLTRLASPPARSTERRYSDSAVEIEENMIHRREELIDLHDPDNTIGKDGAEANETSMSALDPHRDSSEFSTHVETPEIFIYDYGTVVLWGMTPAQERRFLNDMSKFADTPLPPQSTQAENFNFYYTKEYQARIYNDFISLREPKNYMIKLAISHALAQSVKTSLFEDLVSTTIDTCAPLPALIAETGTVNLTRKELNMQVGELFILRINIHLQGSVLDSPELMWAEPQLEPVYQAVRSYLEIGQRVELLTERLDVIADLLAVLREQGSRKHGEVLEWIVIALVAAEIIVAGINIVVDLYAGID